MRKTSFEGQIEQAVAGDVINKGTRIDNSNVINLHLKGQSEEQQLSGECLTFQQKAVISKLVKKIVEVTEINSLEVWNQVLARTGSKKVKLIPKEHYVDLEKYLNDWLNEVTQAVARAKVKVPPPPPVALSAPMNKPIVERQRAIPCAVCEVAKEEISRKRIIMLGAVLAALISIIAFIFVSIKAYNLNKSLQATQARLNLCEFQGSSYTVGGIRRDLNNAEVECVRIDNDPPQWKITKSGVRSEKKVASPKNRTLRRNSSEFDGNSVNGSNVIE